MWQISDGPEICVEIKFFPQRHVDAGEAATDRGCDRSLQTDASALDRLDDFLGDVLAGLLVSLRTDRESFPLELDAGGFQNSHDRLCDFRADAIAGDEGDFVTHDFNSGVRG